MFSLLSSPPIRHQCQVQGLLHYIQMVTCGCKWKKTNFNENLQWRCQRYWGFPPGIIVNVSAVLWTIDCPTKGSVNTLVGNFWVSNELTENDVYLEFDRYRNYSTKSITRTVRGITSWLINRLRIKSQLPPSYYMRPNPKWQPFSQSQHSRPPCSDRRRWSSNSGF